MSRVGTPVLCRNLRTLFNFEPPATARDREVEASRAKARSAERFRQLPD